MTSKFKDLEREIDGTESFSDVDLSRKVAEARGFDEPAYRRHCVFGKGVEPSYQTDVAFGNAYPAEAVDIRDIYKLPNLVGIITGKKRFRTIKETVDIEKDRLERKLRKKGRDFSESAVKSLLNKIVSEKYGSRVYNKVYDIHALNVINKSTQKYFAGDPELEEFFPVYGKLTFDGKEVIGYQNGKTAYFKVDPEKALGSFCKLVLEKSGLSKEQFEWAYREYVKLHENNEAAYQKYTLLNELPSDEHGKLEAYTLKSLKHSKASGAQEIYKVGVLVDSLRSDEFGGKIRKHADPDIRFDLSRRYASA